MAWFAVPRTRLRDPVALHRRHPGRRPACAGLEDLHPGRLRQRGHRAAAGTRTRRVSRSPVERPDAGVQGHGDAVARQPVRVRTRAARPALEHPRRHVGRHRQRGRIRDAGQTRREGLHAQPARPHEPVPAGADVQPAGREHPQHRHRGCVRRLPGHRQGRLQRPGVQAPLPHRHRELDQLGAAAGAGRLLLCRLLPGHEEQHRRTTPKS